MPDRHCVRGACGAGIVVDDRVCLELTTARAIVLEISVALMIAYTPRLHRVFGTAGLSPAQQLTVVPFPFNVWGADALRFNNGLILLLQAICGFGLAGREMIAPANS